MQALVNFMSRPLYSVKETQYQLNRTLGVPSASLDILEKKKKSVAPNRFRNPHRPASGVVSIPTTLLWLLQNP